MGVTDIARDALFGSPPSPAWKPSREGLLAAFSILSDALSASGFADQIFDTAAAGISATTDGSIFLVKGSGNDFASLYKNEGGAAVALGLSLPSSASIALKATIEELASEVARAQDAEDALGERIDAVESLRARFKSFSGVAIPCGSADEHADRSDHSPGG